MRQVVNSYWVRSAEGLDYGRGAVARGLEVVRLVPNLAWLAMIVLAAFMLSLSTMTRNHTEYKQAEAIKAGTVSEVNRVRQVNEGIRARTEQLRSDPKAGRSAARSRLRLVGRNEVVLAIR